MLIAAFMAAVFSVITALLILPFSAKSLGLALLLVFLLFALLKPVSFFIFFILARPVMDLASTQKFMGLNLASAMTALFIIICLAMILSKDNLKRIAGNKFLSRFNKLFLIFTVFSLASCVNTRSALAAVSDLSRLISIIVAVNFGFLYFPDSKKKLKLVWLIAWSATAPLLFGAYQLIFKKGAAELGFNRLYGTFTHPNVFAQYLLIIFYILFYIAGSDKTKSLSKKIPLYTFLFLAVTGIFFTYMRGAWIALAASFSLFIFIRTGFPVKIKYIVFGLLILMLCLPQVKKRFSDINETKYYELSSWQWRLQSWSKAAESLNLHPIIGNGMGMYERDFEIEAHNDYLRIAYESGFTGLTFYLSILFYVIHFAFRKIINAVTPQEINRYKIALCLTVSMMITSAADNLARSTLVLVYFFLALVYFLGIENYENPAG